MSQLYSLVYQAGPCAEASVCLNSPENSGVPRCIDCRLSENGGRACYWWPKGAAKHPVLENEKKDARFKRVAERVAKLAKRDPARRQVQKAAQRAEKKTHDNIIRFTVNSGRSNQDGDHISANLITLDTKLQSRTTNPVIHISQLDKVRADAVRAGLLIGGLVLRNENGRGVVVLDEEDYARIMRAIRH